MSPIKFLLICVGIWLVSKLVRFLVETVVPWWRGGGRRL